MYKQELSVVLKCSLAICRRNVVFPTPRAPLIPIILSFQSISSIRYLLNVDCRWLTKYLCVLKNDSIFEL